MRHLYIFDEKEILKTDFCKISREGGNSFISPKGADGQSNMTTSLYKFRSISHDHLISSAVPCKYSEPCHGSTL
jgi:hypothetical protein